jgi:hypothetical protein
VNAVLAESGLLFMFPAVVAAILEKRVTPRAVGVADAAVQATSCQLMIGSTICPVLGGPIVITIGYGGLGLAALVINAKALIMFLKMNKVDGSFVCAAAAT